MYAKISLNFGRKNILIIPVSAMLKQQGTNNKYVFIEKDGIAVKKNVIPGKRYDDQIEIISGINSGENLIIAGQAKLMNGSQVEVVKN